MCVPSLRFAYCTAVESHSFDRISRDFNFEVPGYCVLKNLGGLLVWVLWQHIPAVLDPEGRGGRFVAWFWAWFWNCLLTPWTFDSSGHTIGATCLPPTARSDNSFDKFVLLIVLLSLWPIWIGTVRGFGVLFKARVDLERGIACRWMVMVY